MTEKKFIRYNRNLRNAARALRNNQTESEKIVWNILRNFFSDFHFMRQKPLDNFIVDFYCSKLNLILEIDGDVHLTQKEKDLERDNLFVQKYSIKTLRIPNKVVENNIKLLELLEKI